MNYTIKRLKEKITEAPDKFQKSAHMFSTADVIEAYIAKTIEAQTIDGKPLIEF